MGFFSFLPFVDDDPEPARQQRPVLQRTAAEKTTSSSGNVRYPHVRAPESAQPRTPGVRSTAPERVPGGAARGPTISPTVDRDPFKKTDTSSKSKPIDLSDPVYQMLVDAGWEPPPRAVGTRRNSNLASLDMTKATDLKGYDYQVTDDEWTMLQNSLIGGGYKGPTGVNTKAPPSIKGQTLKAAPMTWEAYNALNDDQRRAVDFNTLLVEARQKDLADTGADGATVVPDKYGETVERIFGKGGGSNKTATNTVNLLDKIGLEAKGQDLDEFLSLDRAVTFDELQDFKFTEGEVVGLVSEKKNGPRVPGVPSSQTQVLESNFGDVRSRLNQARIDTSAIDKAGEFLAAAFADSNTSLWDLSSTANAALTGARPAAASIPFGFGLPQERGVETDEDKKERTFQGLYGVVQDKNTTDIQAIWDAIDEHKVTNWTDEDTRDLWDYFNTRTVMDTRAGLGAGDATIRNSTEIRQFLGL